VRRCVVSRKSIGLKICCIGNGGTTGEFVWVSQIIHQVIIHLHRLTEKIGQPLIILVSDSSVSSVSIHKSISVDSFLFLVLSRKSHTKIRVLSFYHSLDCIEVFVLVDGRSFFLRNFFHPSCSSPSFPIVSGRCRSFPIVICIVQKTIRSDCSGRYSSQKKRNSSAPHRSNL
jgi:hypothetical protein